MIRKAKAHWEGTLKEGKGYLNTESGALYKTPYSYKMRFEDGVKGSNPEEILGAALAGCFIMSVASVLTKKGMKPESLDAEANVSLENAIITGIHLSANGHVPGLDYNEFKRIVEEESKNCIVGKTLKIPITTEAQLIA